MGELLEGGVAEILNREKQLPIVVESRETSRRRRRRQRAQKSTVENSHNRIKASSVGGMFSPK